MRALRPVADFRGRPREFEPHAGPELRGGDHVASLAGESQGKLTPSTMWVLRDQALCRICWEAQVFRSPIGRGNPQLIFSLILAPSDGVILDFPRDKLLALARQYVEFVMPLVREQERLIDQSRAEAVEHPLTRRVLETLGTASNAVVAYQSLLRDLEGSGDDQ